jgi:hypothetical protein
MYPTITLHGVTTQKTSTGIFTAVSHVIVAQFACFISTTRCGNGDKTAVTWNSLLLSPTEPACKHVDISQLSSPASQFSRMFHKPVNKSNSRIPWMEDETIAAKEPPFEIRPCDCSTVMKLSFSLFQVGAGPEGICRSSRGARRSGTLHGGHWQRADPPQSHRW